MHSSSSNPPVTLAAAAATPPRADVDWAALGFTHHPTNAYLHYTCNAEGTWDEGRLVAGSDSLTLPICGRGCCVL
jgi:hypothetical protein